MAEAQPELDAVPRQLKKLQSDMTTIFAASLCFPGATFHYHLITQAWLARWTVLAMAWLYIKPTRKTTLMNRQVTQSIATQWRCCCHWTDGLVLVGFCFPSLECWPFSPILPIQEKHSRNHTFLRCGLSATYHCMPLFSEKMNDRITKPFILRC